MAPVLMFSAQPLSSAFAFGRREGRLSRPRSTVHRSIMLANQREDAADSECHQRVSNFRRAVREVGFGKARSKQSTHHDPSCGSPAHPNLHQQPYYSAVLKELLEKRQNIYIDRSVHKTAKGYPAEWDWVAGELKRFKPLGRA